MGIHVSTVVEIVLRTMHIQDKAVGNPNRFLLRFPLHLRRNEALHGQVVRLATNSKDYLNPMDIQLSHKGDKEALKLKRSAFRP